MGRYTVFYYCALRTVQTVSKPGRTGGAEPAHKPHAASCTAFFNFFNARLSNVSMPGTDCPIVSLVLLEAGFMAYVSGSVEG